VEGTSRLTKRWIKVCSSVLVEAFVFFPVLPLSSFHMPHTSVLPALSTLLLFTDFVYREAIFDFSVFPPVWVQTDCSDTRQNFLVASEKNLIIFIFGRRSTAPVMFGVTLKLYLNLIGLQMEVGLMLVCHQLDGSVFECIGKLCHLNFTIEIL